MAVPEISHSFVTERSSERPGAVKGAFFAAKRTLDGEDRSERLPCEGMAPPLSIVGGPVSPTTNPEYPKSQKKETNRNERNYGRKWNESSTACGFLDEELAGRERVNAARSQAQQRASRPKVQVANCQSRPRYMERRKGCPLGAAL